MTTDRRHEDMPGSADNTHQRFHRQSFVLSAVIIASVVPASGHAAPSVSGNESTQIPVRYDHRDLTSPVAAGRLLHRIHEAALEACGASVFSLPEVKLATRESLCWRNAVADAVRLIDSAMLTSVANNNSGEIADPHGSHGR